MKPQQDPRAEQLEELLSSRANRSESIQWPPAVPNAVDAELSEMAILARSLQASPSLTVDPDFAKSLERKVLAHNARQRQTAAAKKHGYGLPGWAPQAWIAFVTILLCMFIGTGTVLATASSAANPDNPLYGIKVWEQHAQLSLASSPQSKADISLQIIRDRLKAATSMTDASHADAYQQTIQDADQQIAAVSQTINALPAGPDQQRLTSELTTLKTNARQTLYSLLPKLPLTAQLATTTLLGHLGTPVPSIQNAAMVITDPTRKLARITITGTNLTSSTRLVINNRLVAGNCTLHQNTCVFTITWHDQSPPSSIAVLNEDGTVAQTTAITFTDTGSNHKENAHRESNKNGGKGDNNRDNNKKDGNSGNGE